MCFDEMLPPPFSPAAVAPSAAGAAVHGGQHARLGTPAPWSSAEWLQRPGGPRGSGGPWGRSDRRLGAGRYRGLHGGSGGLNGTLGPGAPPSPAQPEEVSLQRQQQAGPLAGSGGVSDSTTSPQWPDQQHCRRASSHCFFLLCLRLSGSYSSFSLASSPTRECLALLRSHGETTATSTTTRNSVLYPHRSLLSPSLGQGCCIPTRGTTPGVRGAWMPLSHRFVRLPSFQSTLFLFSCQPFMFLNSFCVVTWPVGKHRTSTGRKREDFFPPHCQYISGTSRSVILSFHLYWFLYCQIDFSDSPF